MAIKSIKNQYKEKNELVRSTKITFELPEGETYQVAQNILIYPFNNSDHCNLFYKHFKISCCK